MDALQYDSESSESSEHSDAKEVNGGEGATGVDEVTGGGDGDAAVNRSTGQQGVDDDKVEGEGDSGSSNCSSSDSSSDSSDESSSDSESDSDDDDDTSSSTPSPLCTVCQNQAWKYRCAGCPDMKRERWGEVRVARVCSIVCLRAHGRDDGCSTTTAGARTAYRPKSAFSDTSFARDVRFLQEADKVVYGATRGEVGGNSSGGRGWARQVQLARTSCGVRLVAGPPGLPPCIVKGPAGIEWIARIRRGTGGREQTEHLAVSATPAGALSLGEDQLVVVRTASESLATLPLSEPLSVSLKGLSLVHGLSLWIDPPTDSLDTPIIPWPRQGKATSGERKRDAAAAAVVGEGERDEKVQKKEEEEEEEEGGEGGGGGGAGGGANVA